MFNKRSLHFWNETPLLAYYIALYSYIKQFIQKYIYVFLHKKIRDTFASLAFLTFDKLHRSKTGNTMLRVLVLVMALNNNSLE